MELDFPSASLMDLVICCVTLRLKLFESWVDGSGEVLGAAASVAELLIDGHGGHLTAAAASVLVLLLEGHDGMIGYPSTVDFFVLFLFDNFPS